MGKETAVEQMKSMIPYVDVMKVSDEELVLLTGNKDYSQAVKILLDIGPKGFFLQQNRDRRNYQDLK